MKEQGFISKMKKLINDREDTWWYKIPDLGFPSDKQRFSIKRPFDIVVVQNGQAIAIEAKMVQKGHSFPFKKLSDHQVDNLQRFRKAGGTSLVAIRFEEIRKEVLVAFTFVESYILEGKVKSIKDVVLFKADCMSMFKEGRLGK